MRWLQVSLCRTPFAYREQVYNSTKLSLFRHHFEIVCEQTSHCTRLHDIESSKRTQSQLVAAVDLCDGHETELLLCYNRKSIVIAKVFCH